MSNKSKHQPQNHWVEGDLRLVGLLDTRMIGLLKAIEASGLKIVEAELTYVPKNTIEITDPVVAQKVENLMDALDELDDVVATHTNFDIADGVEL